MLVLGAHRVEFVQEGLVGHRPRPQTLLVQHGQNAVLVLVVQQRRGGGEAMESVKKKKKNLISIALRSAGLC